MRIFAFTRKEAKTFDIILPKDENVIFVMVNKNEIFDVSVDDLTNTELVLLWKNNFLDLERDIPIHGNSTTNLLSHPRIQEYLKIKGK